MNDMSNPDAFGVLTEPAMLTIKRVLPGPVERVWAYLTESDLRRKWMAAGDMELAVGAPFELTWRNDELTNPPGRRPEDFGEVHSMRSEITEVDPPRRLSFTWGNTGGVTFQLEPLGDNKALLTVIHRRVADPSVRLNVCAGWHAHLDVLAARMSGTEPETFWDHWSKLKQEYQTRLSA
ncbi:MAG: SRPBCC family protein [Mesorhizobium sp.]|nr:SRPBCC family protein [Mesorhizobium sp.]MBL8578045.1 SRPBCC family protein [Mesorhizobium sp.]